MPCRVASAWRMHKPSHPFGFVFLCYYFLGFSVSFDPIKRDLISCIITMCTWADLAGVVTTAGTREGYKRSPSQFRDSLNWKKTTSLSSLSPPPIKILLLILRSILGNNSPSEQRPVLPSKDRCWWFRKIFRTTFYRYRTTVISTPRQRGGLFVS